MALMMTGLGCSKRYTSNKPTTDVVAGVGGTYTWLFRYWIPGPVVQ
jgi:hypothetical protein